MIIAIDGPAGSGKTTIAKLLAKELNIGYLDTGATYRALTLKCLREGVNLGERKRVLEIARNLLLRIEGDRVFLDNRDVSRDIRTPQIDKNISLVASNPWVRKEMVKLQRKLVEDKDYVVEGRDITTVVFPYAWYKFYLDAQLEERAKRRLNQLREKGIKIEFAEVKESIKKRDNADITRNVGALKKSEDAVYLDTTTLSISQVLEKILSYIKES